MTITTKTKTVTVTPAVPAVTREETASLFMEADGNKARLFAELYERTDGVRLARVATTDECNKFSPVAQFFDADAALEAAEFFRQLAGILGATVEAAKPDEVRPFDVASMKELIGKESGLIRVTNADESEDPLCLSLMSNCWWLTTRELDNAIVFLQRLRATCLVLAGR